MLRGSLEQGEKFVPGQGRLFKNRAEGPLGDIFSLGNDHQANLTARSLLDESTVATSASVRGLFETYASKDLDYLSGRNRWYPAQPTATSRGVV